MYLWWQQYYMDPNNGDGKDLGGGSDKDNKKANLNPWALPGDNKGSGGEGGGGQQDANAGGGGGGGQQPDPNEAIAKAIAKLDLTKGIDFTALAAAAREGDTEAIENSFKTLAANVFQQAIVQSNSLVDRRAEEASKKATADATKQVQSDQALARLQTSMPFLKSAAAEPLAKAALAGFMRQGQGVDDAVASAERYFAEFGGQLGEHFSGTEPPEDIVGLKAFNANASNGSGDNDNDGLPGAPAGEREDWMDLFGVPQDDTGQQQQQE